MSDEPVPVDEEDHVLDVSIQDSEDTATLQDMDMDSVFEPVPTSRIAKGRGKCSSSKVKKTSEESDIETIERVSISKLYQLYPV